MKIKRIKFIRTPYFYYIGHQLWRMKCEYFPPLPLGVITGYLKNKGIEIEQDDLQVKVHYDNLHNPDQNTHIDGEVFFDKDRILSYLRGNKDTYLDELSETITRKTKFEEFDLILISSPPPIDITPLLSTLLICKSIKKKYPQIPICVGGAAGPQEWLLGLRLKIIDFIIVGPGEIALEKLIDVLRNNKDLSIVPGLTWLRNGEIASSPSVAPTILVNPDFSGLLLPNYYWEDATFSKIGVKLKALPPKILVLPFRFIINCPFRCAFCEQSGREKKVLFLQPKKAVDWLETLCDKYGTHYFFFLHSTINLSKKYINEFCDGVVRRNLKIYWSDCANFRNVDRETLFKLREAGAVRLIWGLETGSPGLLRYIDKRVTLDKAAEMLRASHEAGIWNGLELIAGLPHEKDEDIQATIDFVNRCREFIDIIWFNPFFLDGNSLIYKFPEKYGIKNIRQINRYASHSTDSLIDHYNFPYAFDEINGLKWQDKLKQIDYSLKKLMQNMSGGFETNESVPILFYLYTFFDSNKNRIREIYNKWADYKEGKL